MRPPIKREQDTEKLQMKLVVGYGEACGCS